MWLGVLVAGIGIWNLSGGNIVWGITEIILGVGVFLGNAWWLTRGGTEAEKLDQRETALSLRERALELHRRERELEAREGKLRKRS